MESIYSHLLATSNIWTSTSWSTPQPHSSAGRQLRWPLQHQVTICTTLPFPFPAQRHYKQVLIFLPGAGNIYESGSSSSSMVSSGLSQQSWKATKRKAQCPRRGGTFQGRFLPRGWQEPIPWEPVGPWGSSRPPGLVRHQDPWESCSAWRDLPFFDWCPTPKHMFLPAQCKTREVLNTFPRNTWVPAGCGSSPGPPALWPNNG